MRIPRSTVLLPALLVAWLVGCVAVHGPSIFAYLAMHAVTTGVFATFMWRAERSLKTVSHESSSVPQDEAEPAPMHAGEKAAVA